MCSWRFKGPPTEPWGKRSWHYMIRDSMRPNLPEARHTRHQHIRTRGTKAPADPRPSDRTRSNPMTSKIRHASCIMGGVGGLEKPCIHAHNHTHPFTTHSHACSHTAAIHKHKHAKKKKMPNWAAVNVVLNGQFVPAIWSI